MPTSEYNNMSDTQTVSHNIAAAILPGHTGYLAEPEGSQACT
jgi:hypothetical protein